MTVHGPWGMTPGTIPRDLESSFLHFFMSTTETQTNRNFHDLLRFAPGKGKGEKMQRKRYI